MVHASISLGAVAARRVSSHVEPFAARKAFPISLRQLIFFGRDVNRDKLVTAGNFIRTELPVRLAHRIKDLEVLPYVVGSNPVIKPVFERYVDAFERIRTYPVIRTFEDNLQFCEFMKGLLEEHLVIIPLLARALQDSAKETPASQLDAFMAKMLRSRISRRILTQQHIALSEQYASGSFERGAASDRFVGVVDNRLCPAEVAERCARLVTSAMIDEVPEHEHAQLRFDIDGNTKATFSYLPEHLEYILFELYRNSAKATLARHGDHACEHPISTTICESGTDMLIRVSDQGVFLLFSLSILTDPVSQLAGSPRSI
ncbi:uncharacterized protein L969DRAFT_49217 [Mixia osmundae IAM 14324]|uniref:uncharacterized protein n=1 Tax=Mixia osmundae (strain CBS 9802 / IAM 14324 / JCM 22182 / KY 12970) TaxID=764103 RepID=UPI0004A54D98|nr:uncharacterized protein L969DRAFT_49217 [Mixia osmundae IAM 14324]KEI39360.1 hypothetical protein L969DRAFT_49217 [Mixia osmundae IAM 14324]